MKIRLSYSTIENFLKCERKFQLDKLLTTASKEEPNPTFIFGHAFGEGVVSYLLSGDRDKSIFDTWKAFYPLIEDDKKNLPRCISLIENSILLMDTIREDWEIATFQDKPAIELSFKITGFNMNSTDVRTGEKNEVYYVGYVDAVLRNRWTGVYAILENKHTGMALSDLTPLYKNSAQGLGYSIVLDTIVGKDYSQYGVFYLVGQMGRTSKDDKALEFYFPKTLRDRQNWSLALGLDVYRMDTMLQYNVFPRRGGSCLAYNRPCYHINTCHINALDSYREEVEDTKEYMFTLDINEIIQSHIERI